MTEKSNRSPKASLLSAMRPSDTALRVVDQDIYREALLSGMIPDTVRQIINSYIYVSTWNDAESILMDLFDIEPDGYLPLAYDIEKTDEDYKILKKKLEYILEELEPSDIRFTSNFRNRIVNYFYGIKKQPFTPIPPKSALRDLISLLNKYNIDLNTIVKGRLGIDVNKLYLIQKEANALQKATMGRRFK